MGIFMSLKKKITVTDIYADPYLSPANLDIISLDDESEDCDDYNPDDDPFSFYNPNEQDKYIQEAINALDEDEQIKYPPMPKYPEPTNDQQFLVPTLDAGNWWQSKTAQAPPMSMQEIENKIIELTNLANKRKAEAEAIQKAKQDYIDAQRYATIPVNKTTVGGWEIVGDEDNLTIVHKKSGKAFLSITDDAIIIGETGGEHIKLARTP